MLLRTSVFHTSGELLCSDLPIPLKTEGRANYWQGLGSAITYARRYSLLAIYGLAGEDDEAEAAPAPAAKAKPAAASSMRKQHTPAQALQGDAPGAPGPPAAEADTDICWLEKERHGRIVESLKSAPNQDEVLTAFKVPGVNYVGGSRQLRRRVGAPNPLPWQGVGPRCCWRVVVG